MKKTMVIVSKKSVRIAVRFGYIQLFTSTQVLYNNNLEITMKTRGSILQIYAILSNDFFERAFRGNFIIVCTPLFVNQRSLIL
jgi:hypothetical protein